MFLIMVFESPIPPDKRIRRVLKSYFFSFFEVVYSLDAKNVSLIRTYAMRDNARRIWASTPQNCPTTNQVDFEQLIYSQEVRERF
jgi:hypothetical protein